MSIKHRILRYPNLYGLNGITLDTLHVHIIHNLPNIGTEWNIHVFANRSDSTNFMHPRVDAHILFKRTSDSWGLKPGISKFVFDCPRHITLANIKGFSCMGLLIMINILHILIWSVGTIFFIVYHYYFLESLLPFRFE